MKGLCYAIKHLKWDD